MTKSHNNIDDDHQYGTETGDKVDEKSALRALIQRNETALAWFIERYAPYVNTIIFNIIGAKIPVGDIEEVASDVFLVLWRNAKKIHPGKVKAYLSGVARNMAKDRLRQAGQDLPLEEDVLIPSALDIEHDIEVREQARLIHQAMLNMDFPDREIFLRHYYYYQPLLQIAEEMEMNLSTIKTRLRRGRSKLKDELRKGGFCDEDI